MNVQEYIESGVLELYVMGTLSEEEARDVERMASDNEAIRNEIAAIEESLMQAAMQGGVAPRAGLREKVLRAAVDPHEHPTAENVIAMNKATRRSDVKRVRHITSITYMLAASVVFMALGLGSAIFFALKWKSAEHEAKELASENARLQSRLGDRIAMETMLLDSSTHRITMKGTKMAPNARALVVWNRASHSVMLVAGALPPTPEGKQYQLWAIANNEPVDAGVFDAAPGDSTLHPMKGIDNAEAFAVTLEPLGGSAHPTLDAMMAMGRI